MPISAFAQTHRKTRYMQNLMTPPRGPYPPATPPVLMVIKTYHSANPFQAVEIEFDTPIFLWYKQDNDPLINQSPWRNKLPGAEGETLGGFPVKFLVQVVHIPALTSHPKNPLILGSNERSPLVLWLDTAFENPHDQKRAHQAFKGNEHRG